jgi:hypothetical protein
MEQTPAWDKYIKVLNRLLKACKDDKEKQDEAEKKINSFLDDFVRPFSSDPWTLSLVPDLKPYQICVLAHSCNPVRCIAMMEPHPHIQKLKRKHLTWVFRKITFCGSDKDSIRCDPVSKTQQSLYAEKRGFWVILNLKPDIISNVYEDNSKRAVIFELYQKYVAGMEQCPENESLMRNRGEQFDLKNYPTKEWKESVERRKQSTAVETNKKKKQKTSHGEIKENGHVSKSEANQIPVYGDSAPVNAGIIPEYKHNDAEDKVFVPTTVAHDTFLDLFLQHEKALDAAKALFDLRHEDENFESDPFGIGQSV